MGMTGRASTRPESRLTASLTLAILISCSRFGAALGLALVTIVRESITDREKDAMLRVSPASAEKSLDWPQEQQAMWKGIQAAFYFCAACGFAGMPIAAPSGADVKR